MSIVHSHPGHGILSRGPRRLTIIVDTLRKMSPDQGRPAPGTHWSRDKGESVFHSVLSTENNTKATHRDKEDKHYGTHTARVRTSGGQPPVGCLSHPPAEGGGCVGYHACGERTRVCTAMQVTSAG